MLKNAVAGSLVILFIMGWLIVIFCVVPTLTLWLYRAWSV